MDAVRNAILRALEKGDAQDRNFREKVYRQAFAALDRSLQSRSDLSAEAVQQQREQVKAVIVEIERGFREAPASEAAPEPAPHDPAAAPEPEADFMPRVQQGDRLDGGYREAEPQQAESHAFREQPLRRRPYGVILVIAALLGAIGIGLWILVQTGMLQAIGTAVTNGPAAVSGNASGDGPARLSEQNGDWITVFTPDDPTTVTTPPGVTAQVMNDSDGAFMRIGNGANEEPISFDIGQGILERLAGSRAVVTIEARAAEGQETQISVSCRLASLGDCGRKRFVVGPQRADYLFEVSLPDRNPGAGGTISIVPDVEGQGRALDIFSLRVSTAN